MRFVLLAVLASCAGKPYVEVTNRDVAPVLVRAGNTSTPDRTEAFLLPGHSAHFALHVKGEASAVIDVLVYGRVTQHAESGYYEDEPMTNDHECFDVTRASISPRRCD